MKIRIGWTVCLLMALSGPDVALAENTATIPGAVNSSLRIQTDGVSTNDVWVEDATPNCQSSFTVEWDMTVNQNLLGGVLDGNDRLPVFLARQESPARDVVQCELAKFAPPCGNTSLQAPVGGDLGGVQAECNLLLICYAYHDNGIRLSFGAADFESTTSHTFRIEMVMSPDTTSDLGEARLYLDGLLVGERVGIPNSTLCYDHQRLGLVKPLVAGKIGKATSYFLDNFVSTD